MLVQNDPVYSIDGRYALRYHLPALPKPIWVMEEGVLFTANKAFEWREEGKSRRGLRDDFEQRQSPMPAASVSGAAGPHVVAEYVVVFAVHRSTMQRNPLTRY